MSLTSLVSPSIARSAGRVALVAVCLACGSGCLGFRRDWKDAANYACMGEHEIAGRWEGTWISHVNGHHGKLKAVIVKHGDDCYQAHFFATYAVLIPYAFEIPMNVSLSEDGQSYCFAGQAKLGPLAGGKFQYSGYADTCEFVANYCSKNDQGVFSMRRVPCDECCPTCP